MNLFMVKGKKMNDTEARAAALSNPLALPSDINYGNELTADPQDATRLPTAATNGTEMPARIVIAKNSRGYCNQTIYLR